MRLMHSDALRSRQTGWNDSGLTYASFTRLEYSYVLQLMR